MIRRRTILLLLAAVPAAGAASQAPVSSNPVVEFRGRIARVQLAAGQGTPFLEVKQGDTSTKVWLGSMRYLMEQDFNPKADQEVAVKGYKTGSDVIAIRITANGKTINLRDEQGYPLWQRGRHGQGGKR